MQCSTDTFQPWETRKHLCTSNYSHNHQSEPWKAKFEWEKGVLSRNTRKYKTTLDPTLSSSDAYTKTMNQCRKELRPVVTINSGPHALKAFQGGFDNEEEIENCYFGRAAKF